MHTDTEQRRRERVQVLADELYRDRRHYLLRIANRNAVNREDAEDSLNAAFVSFLEKFDPDCEAPLLAWITTAAKRFCWAADRSERQGCGLLGQVAPLHRRRPGRAGRVQVGRPAGAWRR
ncbi:MAG: sigma-70 family RNA polymerase sigma factor [Solirubrobacterales bacterium]|nr:sigma-70 family RNA polymerase sigma factor [Solirubrobacterales bacterium]